MKTVVICGGHFSPALALIEELQKNKNVKLVFLGRKYATEGSKSESAEYRIISQMGIPFYQITTGRLQRHFTRHTIPSLLKLPIGFIQSFIFLLKTRPNLIISFGGYVSTPPIIAGWLIGITSITHEQASVPGLANKINSLFVDRIFLSWPKTQKYFEKSKCEVIGNLVRPSLIKFQNKPISDKHKTTLYVTGGNQGSHFLNKLIANSLKELSDFQIIHQAGTTNYNGDLDLARKIKKAGYKAYDFIDSSQLGQIYKNADIVVSRSGANTVWEIAMFAKPSLLVPLPHAASAEQKENAKILEDAGSAIIVDQKELTTQVLKEKIGDLVKNLRSYQKKAFEFQKTLPTDGTQKLIKYIASVI